MIVLCFWYCLSTLSICFRKNKKNIHFTGHTPCQMSDLFGDLTRGIDPYVVECSIYSNLMRTPCFSNCPLTVEQELERCNRELAMLNSIVRGDMKRFASVVYQMTLEVDNLKKQSMAWSLQSSLNRAIESATSKWFAELRQMMVFGSWISWLEIHNPLMCTEQLKESLFASLQRFLETPHQLQNLASDLCSFGFPPSMPASP